MTKKTKNDNPPQDPGKPATVNRMYGLGGTDALVITKCESFQLTSNLRWNDGKLEQAWISLETGKQDWRLVPTV